MANDDTRAAVERFVLTLQAALQARAVYGEAHRIAADSATASHARLQEGLAGRTEVTLGVTADRLVFDGQPLHRLGRTADAVTTSFVRAGVAKVTFRRAASRDEIVAFLALVDTLRSTEGAAAAAVDASGLRNIVIEGIANAGAGEKASGPDVAVSACAADYSNGVEVLGDIARSVGDGRPIDAAAANAFVGRILERLIEHQHPLLIAASLKRHDEYSFVHSINVAVLALSLAQGLGLGESVLAEIGMAGFLHDSGKLGVAGRILTKKEKLTEEEFDQVRLHPLDGAKILARTPGLHPLVATAAFEHHLRYDGQGYPRKKFGEGLNLASLIVAITDVYDSLRSNRSYRTGMAPEQAHAEMQGMCGTHLCPELLAAFFRAVGVYPPGTMVELADGHVGIVVAPGAEDARRPRVEVCYLKGAGKVRQPRVVDLAEKQAGGGYTNAISRSVAPSEGYEIPARYKVD
jgi:HD-GYP domain-containing protein (c-di-GMP phosphodiesterase class II)